MLVDLILHILKMYRNNEYSSIVTLDSKYLLSFKGVSYDIVFTKHPLI